MTLAELVSSGVIDNPFLFTWLLFKEGAWIVFLVVIIRGGWLFWMNYIWEHWAAQRKWIILAVDVPRNNEQSPKAIENFFSQLGGIHGAITKYQKYWLGKLPDWISLEIVSIGGNVQYLLRMTDKHRDLVEASIYAQYPDAEITEVEDYVNDVPKFFPNETHKLWGVEFVLQEDDCYPIRTYPEFEHIMAKEMKDPLSAILESMSNVSPDEQVWFQIVATPVGHKWGQKCQALVDKLLGRAQGSAKANPLDFINTGLIQETRQQLAYGQTGVEVTESKVDAGPQQTPLSMLSPGEYKAIEAVQRKMSKWAFECKIRMIYIGRKEVFQPNRVVNPIVGAIKQFSDFNTNSLYPDMKKTATKANYMFTKYRIRRKTRRIFSGYKSRSNYVGRTRYLLNVEELATLWHFPVTYEKASIVQQTESRKVSAPIATPFDNIQETGFEPARRRSLEDLRIDNENVESSEEASEEESQRESSAPPDNLPM